jgi:hypothetical protein
VEAERTGSDEIGTSLDRIEAAVKAGDRDLRELGFWRLVGEVKRDPEAIAAYADQVARIDGAAFRAAPTIRLPVWLGNTILVVSGVAGAAALIAAGRVEDPTVVGILCVGAGAAWTVAFHCPAHWLVGRLGGIRFTTYFVPAKIPPTPGLKIDYATYLRTEPTMRAWMHASGAIGTKLAPFLALALAPRDRIPGWAAGALAAVGVVQLVTDALISVRRGDWKRFLRERQIARSLGRG